MESQESHFFMTGATNALFLSYHCNVKNKVASWKRVTFNVWKNFQTYCFGCKDFLCVKPPNNSDVISKYVNLSDFVSLSKDDNKFVLDDNC